MSEQVSSCHVPSLFEHPARKNGPCDKTRVLRIFSESKFEKNGEIWEDKKSVLEKKISPFLAFYLKRLRNCSQWKSVCQKRSPFHMSISTGLHFK
jgi:hypothetical protein